MWSAGLQETGDGPPPTHNAQAQHSGQAHGNAHGYSHPRAPLLLPIGHSPALAPLDERLAMTRPLPLANADAPG